MIIEKNPTDGTFRYSGYVVDTVQYLAQAFNFTYIMIDYFNYRLLKFECIYYSYTFVNAPN